MSGEIYDDVEEAVTMLLEAKKRCVRAGQVDSAKYINKIIGVLQR